MERDYEITCKKCGSNEVYLLSQQIKKRKWRQRHDVIDRKMKYYFCISSGDSDFEENDKLVLVRMSLICEACGMENSQYHLDLIEELKKDFS